MLPLCDFCTDNKLGPRSVPKHDISVKAPEEQHFPSARLDSAQPPGAIALNEKRSVGGELVVISSNRMSKK